jgi:hypothetical protein
MAEATTHTASCQVTGPLAEHRCRRKVTPRAEDGVTVRVDLVGTDPARRPVGPQDAVLVEAGVAGLDAHDAPEFGAGKAAGGMEPERLSI